MSRTLEMIKGSVKKGWEIFTVVSVPLFAVPSMAALSMMEYGKTDQDQTDDIERFIKACPIALLIICGLCLCMWVFL